MENFLETQTLHLPDLVLNIIIAGIAILVGLLINFLFTRLARYYQPAEEYSLFRSGVTHLARPLNYFIPLLILNSMLPLMELSDEFARNLNRVVEILLIISFAVLLVKSIRIFEDYIYHLYDLQKADNLKERKIRTQLQFIRKVAIGLIVIIAIAVILLSFENVRKIGAGLLTGVGIGGIIIGFAAQRSLANFLAGLQIAFTQPLRIDDVLVVEGEWGKVEEINLTYVVLNIWDERRLILPINYFIEKPFQNWTRTSSNILGTVFIYADYTIPIDDLRAEYDRLLENTSLWDRRVKVIQVTDAKEQTMEIRILMSASSSSMAFDLRCYIRENLIKFIRENYPESLPKSRIVLGDDVFKSLEKSFANK